MKFARILIVEDSKVTRKIIRAMLEQNGYPNVDEAADGSEALSLLERRSYALVISDWNMSPMSGLDLLTNMRARPAYSRIPFVMATAKAHKRFASIARDGGATHYLEKPFTAAVLVECVRSIFSTSRAA